jgi:hypothetical protein
MSSIEGVQKQAEASTPGTSSIGLLFKVLWSPGEAMFQLSRKPRVLAPTLFLCLASVVAGSMMVSKLDFGDMIVRIAEKSRQGASMTDEQKALLRRNMNLPVVKGFMFVSTFIAPLFMMLIIAGIYFALFSMLGRDGGFKAFLSITMYAFIPTVLTQIAGVLRAYLIPASSLMLDEIGSLSAAVFVDRDAVSPAIFTLANSIDVVSIWILSLLVIGYGFVARKSLSKTTRTITVVGVFLLWIAFRVGSAAIRGV